MTTSITIRTDLLLAVSRWTYQSNDRPHLQLVLFKDGEMVACDGHRLVRTPVACNGLTIAIGHDLIAAAAAAQEHCKGLTPRDEVYGGRTAVEISIDSKHAVINLGAFAIRGPLGDATTYPPYEQVMPKKRPERRPDGYGFNPRYLAEIHEIQTAAGAVEGQAGVKVTGWSTDGIGAMLFEGHLGIRYVVMPVKV